VSETLKLLWQWWLRPAAGGRTCVPTVHSRSGSAPAQCDDRLLSAATSDGEFGHGPSQGEARPSTITCRCRCEHSSMRASTL
jgi:hypothetical protein